MFKPYSQSLKITLSLCILIVVFVSGIAIGRADFDFSSFSTNFTVSVKHREPKNKEVDFSLFWQAWDQLLNKYLYAKDLDPQKLLYGAISGMVASAGDPYTAFFDPKHYQELQDTMAGKYGGIGVELGYENGYVVVMSPFSGSPAQKAGIMAGDKFVQIGDEAVDGLTISEVAYKIRGEKGTKVTLTLLHKEEKDPYTVEIERDEIIYSSVTVEFVDDLAYVRILHFADDTNVEWNKAVSEILQQKPRGIVLDLRDNPGGYVNSAVFVAGDFVKNKVVTKQKYADGTEREEKSDGQGRLANYPLIILINNGSASASEILAGALSYYKKGELVGEKSFGKGIVQEELPLASHSAMHITVAEWLLPDGDTIHTVGLEPDVKVERSEDDVKAGRDPQLDKAKELLLNQ